MKNSIGISIEKANELNQELNVLLSSFQVYYQNLRGLHWNIKGKRFFDLHLKFEEFYNDAQLKIDLIAERILTLGGKPLHTFEDYLKNSTINVGKDISNDEKAIQIIVNSIQELLILERKILIISDQATDEGTNAMISDFISEQEKTNWMLRSWLETEV
jgi:starvation-inducible DNA-binding protein